MISLPAVLSVSAIVFAISLIGMLLNQKNLISILMCIELMLLAVNTNFIAFSHYLNDVAGQIFVFFILAVTAAETAIGLAILILIFRRRRSVDTQALDSLRG